MRDLLHVFEGFVAVVEGNVAVESDFGLLHLMTTETRSELISSVLFCRYICM